MSLEQFEPPESLSTVGKDGARQMVHPADVRGRFVRARRLLFVVLMGFYALAPVVTVGGHPAVHLDIIHRAFYLFGNAYDVQDLWLMLLLVLALLFGLLLLTAWRGRIWCGYACPQTVFLEGIFRPIERWIDGPRERRMKNESGSLTLSRVARTVAKHTLYVLAAILVAHIGLCLFVSTHDLYSMIGEGPAAHPVVFGWGVGLTFLMYFNFSWFREQFCIVLCPYGRLQSVLHDQDSVVIGYDAKRGEPRGHMDKAGGQTQPKGDCIDCKRCVVVCPTAIDIRNGLQMECIGCAQCIDACDEVMEKVKRPKGLIRYASMHELAGKPTRLWRPRLFLYLALIAVAVLVFGISLAMHASFECNVLRAPGLPFYFEGDRIRNDVYVHIVNKRSEPRTFEVEVEPHPFIHGEVTTPHTTVPPMGHIKIPIKLWVTKELWKSGASIQMWIEDESTHEHHLRVVPMLGPMN